MSSGELQHLIRLSTSLNTPDNDPVGQCLPCVSAGIPNLELYPGAKVPNLLCTAPDHRSRLLGTPGHTMNFQMWSSTWVGTMFMTHTSKRSQ